MGLRHMDCGTLVADVDDLNSLCVKPHPNRHNVAAAECEHAADTASLQKAGNQVSGTIRLDFHLTTPSC
jgi:hypothetical protein